MNLKNKTTEKLNSGLIALKVITGILIGVLIALFGISLYGFLKTENNGTFIALMVVAISLSAIIPLNYVNIKKIKKELELRESAE